ncbi:membrane protein [Corynebacterium minutissimum]|uniref:Membrane protein n=2 Tax=Corynebacterium minutissimum TaxID=38301 RepID=A0A2X4RRC3_9CORY|nr:membrane protein [Corynebacterium minutissimum]VEG06131.1 membrane protein [Corynebacterium minutissimum]
METLRLFGREAMYQLGIEPHRIPVVMFATVGIYLAFMILVKLFGSRVLTSMTASDAVIIIMFGAVAGRVIIGNPPTLAAGIIGLFTLMLLEAAFGTFRQFVKWSKFIDRRPVLLVYKGELQEDNMVFAHITERDVNSAVRKAGLGRRNDVQLMILEPTGQISVIRRGQLVDASVFKDVLGSERIEEVEEDDSHN